MDFGFHLLAWRRQKKLSQKELAEKTGLQRPYLSRLERGEADPSLSTLRRIAVALEVSLGELLGTRPSLVLSRDDLDLLARGSLRPTPQIVKKLPQARRLARLFKEKRAALNFYRPRRKPEKADRPVSPGVHSLRRLKAELGESQWRALLRRIDKHAAFPSS